MPIRIICRLTKGVRLSSTNSTTVHSGLRVGPFIGVAALFTVVMIGTTLPTPLYVHWQREFSFSPTVTTFIFATYAVGVVVALLFVGGASDQIGRRPILLATIVLSLIASGIFILPGGLPVLFIGRFISGLAAGLITGAATAALSDLAGPGRLTLGSSTAGAVSLFGLGLGPLLAGVLAQYAPAPTRLPFAVHLGLCVLVAFVLLVVPETVEQRNAQQRLIRFRGLGVPENGRRLFFGAAIAAFLTFALVGMFTSVVPSFLGQTLNETNLAVIGATVFLLFFVAALTQGAAASIRGLHHRTSVRAGLTLFIVAVSTVVIGLGLPSYPWFALGTGLAGVTAGLIFFGSLITALEVAPADRRGQVASAYFVAAYIGLTIPIVSVGISAQHFGDFRAILVAAIILGALAILANISLRTPIEDAG